MPEDKRKTRTSTAVKRKYNEKTYGIVTAYLPKEMVTEFKEKCVKEGIPQAQIIRKAIEAYLSK